MTRTITIDPVTRIEGHAKITIYLDEQDQVADARFHVTEFRGFEKFCEGRSFSEMPGITAVDLWHLPGQPSAGLGQSGRLDPACANSTHRRKITPVDELGPDRPEPCAELFSSEWTGSAVGDGE